MSSREIMNAKGHIVEVRDDYNGEFRDPVV